MTDWDHDSPQLRRNLRALLADIESAAQRRESPSIADAKVWHLRAMHKLRVPETACVGRFRGEPGLELTEVAIFAAAGVPAAQVAHQLARFEQRLLAVVQRLDTMYPTPEALDADGLGAVIELAAWAHAEWVRIHPFANGNGRTARLWANALLMRYGVGPVIRLRPRPDGGYAAAAQSAMHGDWAPTTALFTRWVVDAYAGA